MLVDGNILISYHDAVIYPSDLALLDSTTDWLNDACINFQMKHLQHSQDGRRDMRKEGNDDLRRKERGTDLFLDP
jgi:hypothetical protein